ncbi:MAG: RNA 3'-terminal phosphate cyclase, partial [Thermoplasmata archaeon]
MIRIDGSYGEGGGQILRTAVSLAGVFGESIEVYNIRAGRPNPGLRKQHMTAIRVVSEICNGDVEGLSEGSKTIRFYPGEVRGGNFVFDIGTAGSVSLVIQAFLPVVVAHGKECRVVLRGGTDVKWAPPIDYIRHVFIPVLEKMGIRVDVDVRRRGYYPVGGGEVLISVHRCDIHGVSINEKGDMLGVVGFINLSRLSEDVVRRLKHSISLSMLKYELGDVEFHVERASALSPGIGAVLVAKYAKTLLGSAGVGEKGLRAEVLGKNIARSLIEEVNGCGTLDVYMCDQIMPYMA